MAKRITEIEGMGNVQGELLDEYNAILEKANADIHDHNARLLKINKDKENFNLAVDKINTSSSGSWYEY